MYSTDFGDSDFYRRLSAYIVITYGVQKISLSGITLANHSQSRPNSVHVETWRGDNVQEILGAIFGQNRGLG